MTIRTTDLSDRIDTGCTSSIDGMGRLDVSGLVAEAADGTGPGATDPALLIKGTEVVIGPGAVGIGVGSPFGEVTSVVQITVTVLIVTVPADIRFCGATGCSATEGDAGLTVGSVVDTDRGVVRNLDRSRVVSRMAVFAGVGYPYAGEDRIGRVRACRRDASRRRPATMTTGTGGSRPGNGSDIPTGIFEIVIIVVRRPRMAGAGTIPAPLGVTEGAVHVDGAVAVITTAPGTTVGSGRENMTGGTLVGAIVVGFDFDAVVTIPVSTMVDVASHCPTVVPAIGEITVATGTLSAAIGCTGDSAAPFARPGPVITVRGRTTGVGGAVATGGIADQATGTATGAAVGVGGKQATVGIASAVCNVGIIDMGRSRRHR